MLTPVGFLFCEEIFCGYKEVSELSYRPPPPHTRVCVLSVQNKAEYTLVAQTGKSPSAMGETWVRSPGREDPLEKRMASHSSILAWRIPWRQEPGRLVSMGVTKSWTRLSD